MKRILSLLLAAALAMALAPSPAWAAASAPWVQVDGQGTASQTVSVRGLSGSYDTVQLTLTLDKAPGGFTFDQELVNGDTHTAYSVSGNSLTLYVASRNQINQGDAILLGAVTAQGGFTVTSASGLKLLDLDEANMRESSYPAVSIGGPGSAMAFTDVKTGDWFYDAVAYVCSAGMMNGTSTTLFSPQGTTTRGMIVTILYRYEGAPAVGAPGFQDVPAGQYYTDAVAWASASGVVGGYGGGLFGPNDPITREQMAAILYRYAQYKGLDVSGRADLSGYTDAGRISAYAREPMAWANRTGLITGIGSELQPGGSAIRAQAATILMRFCENIAK